jgi:hypothetical protein
MHGSSNAMISAAFANVTGIALSIPASDGLGFSKSHWVLLTLSSNNYPGAIFTQTENMK